MSYTLVLAPRALDDLELIKKSGDQSRIKKIRTILGELQEILCNFASQNQK